RLERAPAGARDLDPHGVPAERELKRRSLGMGERCRTSAAHATASIDLSSQSAPMNDLSREPDRRRLAPLAKKRLLDPRLGDMENDHSATKQRSLLAIAGSLLAEISLTKLLFAGAFSILLPAVLLGLAPLVLTAWVGETSSRLAEVTGVSAILVVLAALSAAWIG